MFSSTTLSESIQRLTDATNFVIGFSGGLDSTVLLHAFMRLAEEQSNITVRAIHVHHGLSQHADAWAEHADTIAKKFNVTCIVKQVDANSSTGQSPENIARSVRYNAFSEELEENECLVTAHTKDDQAETLFLQLLRGAGPKGLAGMPALTGFGKGFHLRPLLNVTRSELEAYAKKNKLEWIEDDSNIDRRFDRNYLRHEIFPLMKKRWPGLLTTCQRVSQNAAEAAELLHEFAKNDLVALQGSQPDTLSANKLKQLSSSRQRNAIRAWLQECKLTLPSRKKLIKIQTDVLQSRHDAMPLVSWQGAEIRRYRDDVYALFPILPHDPTVIIPWDPSSSIELPNGLGVITPEMVKDTRLEKVTIRFRTSGERCQLPGRKGTHRLKKLFQEWHIPPWQRNRIPLIYDGDKLRIILGYTTCN